MSLRPIILLVCLGSIQAELLKLNCTAIRQYVYGHNSRRFQVANGTVPNQPAASKMYGVMWDEELAAKAAKWASNNKFEHNSDRTVPSGRFKTGENIYMSLMDHKHDTFNIDASMAAWFGEHRQYTYDKMTLAAFNSAKRIGHYTQMVWSNSIYIGCAVSRSKKDELIQYLVVCNYGPTGNIIGQMAYPAGKAARHLSCGVKNCSRRYGVDC